MAENAGANRGGFLAFGKRADSAYVPLSVQNDGTLNVNASVTATASTVGKATAAAPTYSEGDAAAPLSLDLAGNLRTLASVSASLAATANASDPSWVEASSHGLTTDLSGHLRVLAKQQGTWSVSIDASQSIGVTNFPAAVSVNSGAKDNGTLRVIQASDDPLVTAIGSKADAKNAATDTTAVSAISLLKQLSAYLGGTLAVSGTFWQATQPVSGTITANAGTNLNTSLLALEGGGNLAALLASLGATSGAAVITDANGTVQQYLRGLVKQWIAGTLVLGAGANLIGNVGHGKTIKTATVNITADTDIIAAVSLKRIKVIAYALFKTGTNANPILFKSNGTGGTELARVLLQSQASAVFGANLSIAAPSFLFATAAGEKLTMDVNDADAITGFITYFDDDAT